MDNRLTLILEAKNTSGPAIQQANDQINKAKKALTDFSVVSKLSSDSIESLKEHITGLTAAGNAFTPTFQRAKTALSGVEDASNMGALALARLHKQTLEASQVADKSALSFERAAAAIKSLSTASSTSSALGGVSLGMRTSSTSTTASLSNRAIELSRRSDAAEARQFIDRLRTGVGSGMSTVSTSNTASLSKRAIELSNADLLQNAIQNGPSAMRNMQLFRERIVQLGTAAQTASGIMYNSFSGALSKLTAPFHGFYELVRGMFIRLAAIAALFAGMQMVKNVVSAGMYLEQQRSILEALTGSAQQAGNMIAWVRKKALETPFEVPGLIEAVTQLRSVHLNYKKWIDPLGTLAVMTGRSMSEGLDMATRAIVRLRSGVTGEAMELLRRMKITREDFAKNGVFFGNGGESLSTPTKMLDALYNIIQTKFPNVMEKLGKTSVVTFSNMKDALTEFYLSIAGVSNEGVISSSGFLGSLKSVAQGALEWFTNNKSTVAEWGAAIGKAFVSVITWIKLNWDTIKEWGRLLLEIAKNVLSAYLGVFEGIMAGFSLFYNIFTGFSSAGKGFQGQITDILNKIRFLTEWFNKMSVAIGIAFSIIIINKWVIGFVFGIAEAIKSMKLLKEAMVTIRALMTVENIMAWGSAILTFLVSPVGIAIAALTSLVAILALINKPDLDNAARSAKNARKQAEEAAAYGASAPNHGYIRIARDELGMNAQQIAFGRQFLEYRKTREYRMGENMVRESGPFGLRRTPISNEEMGWGEQNADLIEEAKRRARRYARDTNRPPETGPAVDMNDYTPLGPLKVLRFQAEQTAEAVSIMKSTYGEFAPQVKETMQNLLGLQKKQVEGVGELEPPLKGSIKWYDWAARMNELARDVQNTQNNIKKFDEGVSKQAVENAKKVKDAWMSALEAIKSYTTAILDYHKSGGAASDIISKDAQRVYIANAASIKEILVSILSPQTDLTAKINGFKALIELMKAQRDLKKDIAFGNQPELIKNATDQAEAYLNYVKESGASQTAILQATLGVINAKKQELDMAQKLLAYYIQIGNAIQAGNSITEITKIKTEILGLQKSMRGNLEDEFSKMASMMINAPADLTRILARTGITYWQKSVQSMQRGMSLGGPGYAYAGVGASTQVPVTNVDVKVYLGTKELDSYVDSRFSKNWNARKGSK